MSGFLARLAARQIAPSGTLRPRAISRFAAPEADVVADGTAPRVVPESRPTAATPDARPVRATSTHAARPAEPTQARPDVHARPEPDHAARVRQLPPHDEVRPQAAAGERRADERAVPGGPLVEVVELAVPLRTPQEEREPHPAPLVARKIVRARTAPESHMPVGARVAAAPAPLVAAPADEPVVRITIGRIEVRAAAPAPAREKRPAARPKTMSLDEYLDRRHGPRR